MRNLVPFGIPDHGQKQLSIDNAHFNVTSEAKPNQALQVISAQLITEIKKYCR
jgi:hypothetical protein